MALAHILVIIIIVIIEFVCKVHYYCQRGSHVFCCFVDFSKAFDSVDYWLFMVALCNRADHYIFMLWFVLLSFYLSFFPRLISAAADWMSAILPHMVWP